MVSGQIGEARGGAPEAPSRHQTLRSAGGSGTRPPPAMETALHTQNTRG